MLPAESLYGAWAQSGEIDIMEAVNLGADNNTVYGTLQYGAAWPNNVSSGTTMIFQSALGIRSMCMRSSGRKVKSDGL